MIEVYKRLPADYQPQGIDFTVILDSDQRAKGRLKIQTTNGRDIGFFLERGKPLQVGDYLQSECGNIIIVGGAIEEVLVATAQDNLQFSRACYHLGNRHVKVEIAELSLKIKFDHVLKDMLQQLGLSTESTSDVFTPENGAYAHGHHHH